MKKSHKKEVKMKKFLALCIVMSLIFVFAMPVLATDINKVDLSSNLTFTFEPSSTVEKPLTIIQFPDVDLTQIQNESSDEVKKSSSLVRWGLCIWFTAFVIAATS